MSLSQDDLNKLVSFMPLPVMNHLKDVSTRFPALRGGLSGIAERTATGFFENELGPVAHLVGMPIKAGLNLIMPGFENVLNPTTRRRPGYENTSLTTPEHLDMISQPPPEILTSPDSDWLAKQMNQTIAPDLTRSDIQPANIPSSPEALAQNITDILKTIQPNANPELPDQAVDMTKEMNVTNVVNKVMELMQSYPATAVTTAGLIKHAVLGTAEAGARAVAPELMQDVDLRRLYRDFNTQTGAIDIGPGPQDYLPGFSPNKFMTSLKESPAIPEEMKVQLEPGVFAEIPNKESWARGQKFVIEDPQNAHDFIMEEGHVQDGDYGAIGLNLIKKYVDEKDIVRANKVALKMASDYSKAGQFVQSASMADTFSPERAVIGAQTLAVKARTPAQVKTLEDTIVKMKEELMAAHNDTIELAAKYGESLLKNKQLVSKMTDILKEEPASAGPIAATEPAAPISRPPAIQSPISKPPATALEPKASGGQDPAKMLANRIRIQKPSGEPDPIKDMVNTLFKVAKEVLPKAGKPIPRDEIELIGQAINKQPEYADVWKRAQEIVKKKYAANPSALNELDQYFKQYVGQPFSVKQITKSLKQEIKSQGIVLDKVVREHFSKLNATQDQLEESLIQKSLVTDPNEAEQLAGKITDEFNRLATQKKMSVALRLLKISQPKELKTDIQRVIELSNVGALDTSLLRDLVAKKFKIPHISTDLATNIVKQADLIQTWPALDKYGKLKAQEDLFKLMQSQVPGSRMEAVAEYANIPRIMMAGFFDFSFPFKQGAVAGVRFPKQWGKSFLEQFPAFKSQQGYERIMNQIMNDPDWQLAEQARVPFIDINTNIRYRAERYQSRFTEDLPKWAGGGIIRATSRAFAGAANYLKMGVFKQYVNAAEAIGLKPRENLDLLRQLGSLTGDITGRANYGKLESFSTLFNATFFSPRYFISRIKLLTAPLGIPGNPLKFMSFYGRSDKFTRIEAARAMLGFSAALGATAVTAKVIGLDVGFDPSSADFMKIKIGNTRLDIGSGFLQLVRGMWQIGTGHYTSSTTGRRNILGEGYKPSTRFDIAQQIFETKEAPLLSLATELLKSVKPNGEKVNPLQAIAQRFEPMLVSDMIDLIKDDASAAKLATGAALSFIGVGVQTYGPPSDFAAAMKSFTDDLRDNRINRMIDLDESQRKTYHNLYRTYKAQKTLDSIPKDVNFRMLKLYNKVRTDKLNQRDRNKAVYAVIDNEKDRKQAKDSYFAIKTLKGMYW